MFEKQNLLTLSNRFEEIKCNYPLKLYRNIHSKSVKNFLHHLDKLASENAYGEVYGLLENYFKLIDEDLIEDRNDAIMLYDKCILPIVKIFNQFAQFHLVIKIQSVIIFSLPVFTLLYLLNANSFYYIVIIIMEIILYIRQLYFERKKVAYGPFY